MLLKLRPIALTMEVWTACLWKASAQVTEAAHEEQTLVNSARSERRQRLQQHERLVAEELDLHSQIEHQIEGECLGGSSGLASECALVRVAAAWDAAEARGSAFGARRPPDRAAARASAGAPAAECSSQQSSSANPTRLLERKLMLT